VGIFDGGYFGDDSGVTDSCDAQGSVASDGDRPLAVLEETLPVLEMCAHKYGTLAPAGDALTVLGGRKVRGVITAIAGLGVPIEHGHAHSSIVRNDMPRGDTEPVTVESSDDVMAIARKVFEVGLRYDRP